MNPLDLGGRKYIVTGAASGIGFAVARTIVEMGGLAAIVDLNAEAAHAAAGRLGSDAVAFHADVSNEDSVKQVVEQVLERFGELHGLVNCAGIPQPAGGTLRQEMAVWDRIIAVNLKGSLMMARAVGRHMVPRRRGVIVNMASGAGLRGGPAINAYGPSKAGVINLTQTLAGDWAKYGIRVNCVAPGSIRTPIWDQLGDMKDMAFDVTVKGVPLGRIGEPDDIAWAVIFLLSDRSAYISGIALPVDGGWSAWGGSGDAWKPPRSESDPGISSR